jgi:hypothetical protein
MERTEQFDSLLYSQVIKGNYPSLQYALLKMKNYSAFGDTTANYQDYPYSYFGTNSCLILDDTLYVTNYLKYLPAYKVKKTETARKSIFLDSLRESIVKIQFQLSHSEFMLVDSDCFPAMSGMPEEIKNRIKSKSFKKEEVDGFNHIGTVRCKYGLRH